MNGLVLSGGGARGAYQVGVLKVVAEICQELKIKYPFKILNGVSAGAINAVKLAAADNGDFVHAVVELERLWSNISSEQVFRTDPGSLGKIGLKWVGKLSLGGLMGGEEGQSLLDTAPLHDLIQSNVKFEQIEANIQNNILSGLAITAIDYRNSQSITFTQSHHSISIWEKPRKRAEKAYVRLEHILASSSIPLLFPPQKVDHRFFGDGCVRNQSPSAPAIYMGSERLFIIGVRSQGTTLSQTKAQSQIQSPSVARVINTLLNSILLDAIEYDVERIERINQLVQAISDKNAQKVGLRELPFFHLTPGNDIGELAIHHAKEMPRVVRYLIKGLGPIEDAGELISYLLFEKEFCRGLIDMGYQDGSRKRSEITQFLTQV